LGDDFYTLQSRTNQSRMNPACKAKRRGAEDNKLGNPNVMALPIMTAMKHN